MSSFDLINLMTLILNLPLNFDVAFYNWVKIFASYSIILSSFPGVQADCIGVSRLLRRGRI